MLSGINCTPLEICHMIMEMMEICALEDAAQQWSALNGIQNHRPDLIRNSVGLMAYIQDGQMKVERGPGFLRMACTQSDAVTALPKASKQEIFALRN